MEPKTGTPLGSPRRVAVKVTPGGAWIVADERNRRGGWFRSDIIALRYIHREFGKNAEIVFQRAEQE